jgi:hypothetical protein
MPDSNDHKTNGCESVEELIVWYPSPTLVGEERQAVEAHVASCSKCAGLLRFASDIKEMLVERPSPHPAADVLVSFVENKSALNRRQRFEVEAHLAACGDCQKQSEMLEAVERDDRGDESIRPTVSTATFEGAGWWSGVQRFVGSLGGGLLKPAPAALYLVVAIVAFGLLISRPGDRDSTRGGRDAGAGLVGGATGVIIVPDEMGRVREPGAAESEGLRIDGSRPQLLLIELTGLTAPPRGDTIYTIEFRDASTARPLLKSTIEGRAFDENYTIGYALNPNALPPGRYIVVVFDALDHVVYQSSFAVR